jgi:hypothetical protein
MPVTGLAILKFGIPRPLRFYRFFPRGILLNIRGQLYYSREHGLTMGKKHNTIMNHDFHGLGRSTVKRKISLLGNDHFLCSRVQ